MKMTRILSLLLVFAMAIGMFTGCCKEEEENPKGGEAVSEKAPETVKPEPEEEKGPSDEELIDEVMTSVSGAICDFDMEKASEYVLDESELEKDLLAAPGFIDEGIEEIKAEATKEIENNSLLKYIGDDAKKTIKDTVSEGLSEGKQAIIDSTEFAWGEKVIDGDKATVDVTVKVGGKKILALMNGGKDDEALDLVLDYLEKVLDEKGTTALFTNTKGVADAVVDKMVDDIKNGEKEEMAFTASLGKTDGKWLITEMKEAEIEE